MYIPLQLRLTLFYTLVLALALWWEAGLSAGEYSRRYAV